MKKTIILILALCTLMGCGSAHQTQLVHQIERDTMYHQNIRYDSIYIYRNRYLDRNKDTIYLRETETKYRYQFLRDTIRIIRRDSIPYEVIVTEIKEVKYIPWWCKTLAWIGGICLALLIKKVK